MSVRIFTDSASDITLQEMEEKQIGLIAMPLLCGEKTYIDDKTIPMTTFWEMLLGEYKDIPSVTGMFCEDF